MRLSSPVLLAAACVACVALGACRGTKTQATEPPVDAHSLTIAACRSFTGCGLWSYFGRGSEQTQCVDTLVRTATNTRTNAFFEPTVRDCIVRAGADCAAVKTCVNGGDPSFACDGGGFGPQNAVCAAYGSDSVSVACVNGARFATNCDTQGTTCVETPAEAGVCGFGTCFQEGSMRCGGSLFGGELVATCSGGIFTLSEDCAQSGSTCVEDADGGAQCVGGGPPCAAPRCDATVLVSCFAGHEAPFDCGPLGLACGEGAGACVYAASDCDPATFVDSCAGPVLTFCDLGRVATTDCVAAGFTSCVSNGTETR